MDFFHCNICYIQPEKSKGLKFFLTNCGHSFCTKCLDSKSKCKLCHAECRIVPLSNDMPENLKSFFSDTAQEAKKIIRILSIQNNHCKIYMEQYAPHLEKKCMHLCQILEEKNKEIESLNNKLKLLSTQMDGMKRDMIKMTTRMPKTPISQNKPLYQEFKEMPNSQYRMGNSSVFMTPATSISTNKSNMSQSYLHRTPMNMSQNAPVQSDRSNILQSYLHRTPKNMTQKAPSVQSDRRSTVSTPQSFHSSQTFVMANEPKESEQMQKKWGSNVTQIRATNLRQIKSLSSRISNLNSSYF